MDFIVIGQKARDRRNDPARGITGDGQNVFGHRWVLRLQRNRVAHQFFQGIGGVGQPVGIGALTRVDHAFCQFDIFGHGVAGRDTGGRDKAAFGGQFEFQIGIARLPRHAAVLRVVKACHLQTQIVLIRPEPWCWGESYDFARHRIGRSRAHFDGNAPCLEPCLPIFRVVQRCAVTCRKDRRIFCLQVRSNDDAIGTGQTRLFGQLRVRDHTDCRDDDLGFDRAAIRQMNRVIGQVPTWGLKLL